MLCSICTCLHDRARPSSTTAPAQQLPDLPEAVVVCILQHVPVRQRLTSCAMVCLLWAAAAAAVPMWDVLLKRNKHCGQLQDWLVKHGGVMAALTAKGDKWGSWRNWRPLQLPFLQLKQLRILELSRLRLKLPAQAVLIHPGETRTMSTCSLVTRSTNRAGRAALAVAVALPQLQELRLSDCQLPIQLASYLLSRTKLSVLHWQYVELHNDCGAEQLAQDQNMSTLWQQLQQLPMLSELQLHEEGAAPADIAPLREVAESATCKAFND